jgi:glycosyltransferase involved in cell wall biosynthesis
MTMPTVSVIITCFNDGEYIEEAIRSVEDSYYPNLEIIVVDDCSSDLVTKQKLATLKSNGFRVLELPENKGVGNARNQGISVATGEYILPLDGDDRVLPNYFSLAVKVFQSQPEIGVVYCNVKRFGAKSTTRISPDYNLPQLLAGNYIASCSLFRRKDWQKTSGYDTSMPNYEDWEFWINLAQLGVGFYHINEVLFEYRAKATSKISKCLDPSHRAKVVQYVVQKHSQFYSKYLPEIIGYLHIAISSTELQMQEQNLLLEKHGASELLEKLKFAEEELVRRTAFYENSFFWKLKKLVEKIRP